MVSPTTNRGMTYPVHGGAVGAWDAPLNADFENMDLAFNTYPITILSSAVGATYNSSGAIVSSTVASVNLPSSIALNFHYPITGVLTRNLTVVWSSVGGFYDVNNATTGAFSITATTNGSTTGGVQVSQGGRSYLVSDGTNGANGMYFGSNVFGDIVTNSITSVSTVSGLNFKATGTGNDVLPSGTTGQRPAVNIGGLRFNTTLGQIEFSDGTVWKVITATARGYIDGCILSNNAGNPATALDIAAGTCRDSTNAYDLNISSAITNKQLDSVWAAGSAAGMRSSAGLANGTWHIFAIGKTDGTVDIFAHTAIDPTAVLPATYTLFRRIGSILRVGAVILAFTQNSDYFELLTTTADINAVNPGVAAVSRALSVPSGILVRARVILTLYNNPGVADTVAFLSDLASTDETPTVTLAGGGVAHTVVTLNNAGRAYIGSTQIDIRTNITAQIRSRLFYSDGNVALIIRTRGWFDLRGKDNQ